jgi:ATP-dependent Lon protease
MTDLTASELTNQHIEQERRYPVLPLRDVVLFPGMVVPLFVGRMKSMHAVEVANAHPDKSIVLLAQKDPSENEPGKDDLYAYGVQANILQYLKLPDNTIKVLVEAQEQIRALEVIDQQAYLEAVIVKAKIQPLSEREYEVLIRSLLTQFDIYSKLNKKITQETVSRLHTYTTAEQITNFIAAHLPIKTTEKQNIIDLISIKERVERLIGIIEAEIDLLQVEQRIRSNVKKRMEKTQREYYLNEQIKAIHEELGVESNELEVLRKRIEDSAMSKEAKEKAFAEIERLKMMPPMSAEATVSRNYIDWLLNVPWSKRSKERFNLTDAIEKLDQQHYALDKVKERIIEYLAVQKRVKKMQGPILCLVGPPGVGKTSLGQSIAEAVHREFARIALGGVRDEAEIRGHRRTYIGAMPGKIIQKLSKIKVSNPVILLDEIDKMASDFRGDPSAALLEVLDPEQNKNFNDHYLDVDYDLSDVMFIATANSMNIPAPLLDRMEVIRLSGYTEDEKLNIAEQHLLPKQMKLTGLKKGELTLDSAAIVSIIRHYTLEAGVRNLERELAKICRKIVKKHLEQDQKNPTTAITPDNLEDYLGVVKYRYYHPENEDKIGLVNGLAWTEVGGEMLTIESVFVKGKGKLTLTGKLGEVMQESIQAALTVVRSRCDLLNIAPKFFEEHDIHIHVPQGATPKDGPSAGITVCTALLSSVIGLPVRADVAMTGEITLRGDVLAIGGLKEKLLAARRSNMKIVLIPEENHRDLKEIPSNITENLDIRCVKSIDEVFQVAIRNFVETTSSK